MKYRKESIKEYKTLGRYPVYCDEIYHGKEPFRIVGIRENQVEIEGDFSGGVHNIKQKEWIDDNKVFVVKSVCEEELRYGGCQIYGSNCCGGGDVVTVHTDLYWGNLVK
jgi:hypothetical protein